MDILAGKVDLQLFRVALSTTEDTVKEARKRRVMGQNDQNVIGVNTGKYKNIDI